MTDLRRAEEAVKMARHEAEAETWEEAAKKVECFDASLGLANCEPCDGCVMAARFRGLKESAISRLSKLRASQEECPGDHSAIPNGLECEHCAPTPPVEEAAICDHERPFCHDTPTCSRPVEEAKP